MTVTETHQQRVLIDVPEHKFASSFSADTGDVNFGQKERRFRLLIKSRHGHLQDQKHAETS